MPMFTEPLHVVGQLLHERARDLADAHRGEQRVADRQHRRAELVLAEAHVVAQVAQLGERVGEPRHRRLGQPGAHRDFLVAEHRLERREAAQHLQAARERGRELAVAFVLVAVGGSAAGKASAAGSDAPMKFSSVVWLRVSRRSAAGMFRISIFHPRQLACQLSHTAFHIAKQRMSKSLFDLTGKVALDHGLHQGIGKSIAEELARAGAKVVGLEPQGRGLRCGARGVREAGLRGAGAALQRVAQGRAAGPRRHDHRQALGPRRHRRGQRGGQSLLRAARRTSRTRPSTRCSTTT